MINFIKKYEELREESTKYIVEFLKNNGGRHDFTTQEEMESDDFADVAWQLPQATYVGKHEYTSYYAITSITLENDVVWFNGVSVGEDSDDYTFGLLEMDVAGLCGCADLLTKTK
jgi:metal-dependent amidase/aminoacylase/carboxypeptidase family protein